MANALYRIVRNRVIHRIRVLYSSSCILFGMSESVRFVMSKFMFWIRHYTMVRVPCQLQHSKRTQTIKCWTSPLWKITNKATSKLYFRTHLIARCTCKQKTVNLLVLELHSTKSFWDWTLHSHVFWYTMVAVLTPNNSNSKCYCASDSASSILYV